MMLISPINWPALTLPRRIVTIEISDHINNATEQAKNNVRFFALSEQHLSLRENAMHQNL